MNQSTFDIIVPCYNYGRYLRGCVASVLDQTDVRVRVLIIDDESSDETEHIGRDLARADSRIEYRRHAKNQGHINTYNEGLAWADRDYVLLLSADDALMPGSLRAAAEIMRSDQRIGMVYGQAFMGTRPPSKHQVDGSTSQRQLICGEDFVRYCMTHVLNPVPTPAAFVRTSVQKQVGQYRSDLPFSADLEMWMRIACRGLVGITNQTLAFYRRHEVNMTYDYTDNPTGDLKEYANAFDQLLDQNQNEIPEASSLRHLAHQAIAWKAFWAAHQCLERGLSDACDANIQLARQTFPAIRSTISYRKMQIKRRLGPTALRWLFGTSGDHPSVAQTEQRQNGRLIGWWPNLHEDLATNS